MRAPIVRSSSSRFCLWEGRPAPNLLWEGLQPRIGPRRASHRESVYRAAMLDCIRESYLASPSDPDIPQAKNTYVCASESGRPTLGMRYIRLTEEFGDDGLALNVCAPDGFGPVMQALGEFAAGAME